MNAPKNDLALETALKHPLMRIRRLALEHMDKVGHADLQATAILCSIDRSAAIREISRWILGRRLGMSPRDALDLDGFDPRSDDEPNALRLAWIETSMDADLADVEHILNTTEKGKIRATALMAFARLNGNTEGTDDLILWALQQDMHTQNVAMRLVRSGWAGPAAPSLWQLARTAKTVNRQIRLMRLAAETNREKSLVPAIGFLKVQHVDVREAVLKLVERWLRAPANWRLTREEQDFVLEALSVIKGPSNLRRTFEAIDFTQ